MKKAFYVTTPIYYPNDKLHIGHAYTTVLADYIARYKKANGYDVFFLTGSDEHGQKIFDKAKEAKEDTYDYVTKIINTFKVLWERLGIDYGLFIRTTDKRHIKFVQQKFSELLKKNYIYEGQYEGFYCKACESYFTSSQLMEKKCPNCGRDVSIIKQDSYFLKVTDFQKFVSDLLKKKKILFPESRVNELIKSFLENDFKDLSISRTDFSWGVPILENKKHVVYVWLDALLNYLSAFSFKERKTKLTLEEVWSKKSKVEILQIVGKEITRFHAIYWPIILEMLNLKQPKILGHGWILIDNTKMSKSIGNVIDPMLLLDKYGRDVLRFYLINNIKTGDDGSYSETLLLETYNSFLVNKYSNLVNRTWTMINKYFKNKIPTTKVTNSKIIALIKKIDGLEKKYHKDMNNYEFSNSTKQIIEIAEVLNKSIDDLKPWSKTGKDLEQIIKFLFDSIYKLNILLQPILIDATSKFFKSVSKDKTKIKQVDFLFTRT